MNADRLVALYDRVAEAPHAIARLRRFVLDLAVRGKLVEQNPTHETAGELLRRIAAASVQLVKAGRINRRLPLQVVPPTNTPYDLPTTWRWVHFGSIADFSAGRTPSRRDTSFWNKGDFPWITIADMEDGGTIQVTKESVSDRARTDVFKSEPAALGTMIMSFKLTIGKIARLGIPAFHNEAIIAIRPYLKEIDPFLFKVLPDFARSGETKGAIKGATLNRESISNILIPLPPVAEQHRIVAKVDELMALFDRLEDAHTTRARTRGRLIQASLARLRTPNANTTTFRSHARFAIHTIPALTVRADQVNHLRQTILDLAVHGKLVEQDPNDEPASSLLERITIAKTRLTRKARKTSAVANDPSSADQVPFNLPSSWGRVHDWRDLFENGFGQYA